MAKKKQPKRQTPPQQSVKTAPVRKLKGSDAEMVRSLERLMPRLATVFIVWVLVVHPLLITPDTYYSLEDVKLFSYWTVASCLLLLTIMVTAIRKWLDPEYLKWQGWKHLARWLRPYEWAALAFFLVMVISTILSEHTWWAIKGTSGRNEGLFNWSLYLFTMMVVGRYYKPKEKHLLWFCIAGAVSAGYGICQFYGYDFLGFGVEGYGGRGSDMLFVSTMSNRNVMMTYACLVFCVCVVMVARLQKRWHWAFLPLGLVAFYMAMNCYTSSGIVGLIVAFTVAIPFLATDFKSAGRLLGMGGLCAFLCWISIVASRVLLNQGHPLSRLERFLLPLAVFLWIIGLGSYFLLGKRAAFPQKPWRIGWYALVAVVMIGGMISLPKIAKATDNAALMQASEILHGDFDDSYGSGRGFVWKRSMQLVKEKPLFGHGPDSFSIVFEERFGEERQAINYPYFDKAHNDYVQVLVDCGVLSLIGLLSVYGLLLWSVRKQLETPLVLAVAMTLLCFAVQSFFNIATPFAHPIVWALWGGLGAMGKPLTEAV